MYAKTVIAGRLTKDVESRQVTINGEQQWVANFPVATDDRGKTDYYDVVVWRKLAENCKNFLGKGRMVLVEGKMKRRDYEGQDGRKVYVWELIADDVRFLDSKGAGQGSPAQTQPQTPASSPAYQPTASPTGYPQHNPTADPYANGIGIADDNLPF